MAHSEHSHQADHVWSGKAQAQLTDAKSKRHIKFVSTSCNFAQQRPNVPKVPLVSGLTNFFFAENGSCCRTGGKIQHGLTPRLTNTTTAPQPNCRVLVMYAHATVCTV